MKHKILLVAAKLGKCSISYDPPNGRFLKLSLEKCFAFVPRQKRLALLGIGMLVLFAPKESANAALIFTADTITATSSSDLLHGLTPTHTGFVGHPSSGPIEVILNDGSHGNPAPSIDGTQALDLTEESPQYILTYTLDLSGAAFGYDISSIDTFTGWQDYRAGQDFDIEYSVVGDTDFNELGNIQEIVTNQNLHLNVTSDTPLTGVDQIRFSINSAPNPTNSKPGSTIGSVWREIDVTGTATVPEPSTMMLALVGGLGMVIQRRRRRR